MAEADRRRWDARYRAHEPGLQQPSGSLVALPDLLPQGARALDVAGGTGRHALWLGHRTTGPRPRPNRGRAHTG
jgi:hypothetical protein